MPSGDDIRPTINEDRAAGDTLGQRRCKVGAREADIHNIDELAERRFLRRFIEQKFEVLQPRRCACLQRPRGNGMHAYPLRTKFVSKISAGRLQCSLHRTHHIVVRHDKLDILVHSIAYAPRADLQGGLLDCSADGFATAMDHSTHSTPSVRPRSPALRFLVDDIHLIANAQLADQALNLGIARGTPGGIAPNGQPVLRMGSLLLLGG
jgi:Enoyl-(Acyl carrier protein) reductase